MDTRTRIQRRRDLRNQRLYDDFCRLTALPGARKTAVTQMLMRKYHIYSTSQVWLIRKKEEQRRKQLDKE